MDNTTKKIMVSIWLDPKIIRLIDNLAKRGHITRSEAIHNLIEVGYDELNLQKNIGLVKLTLLLRQFKQSVRPVINEAEKRIVVDGEHPKKGSVSIRLNTDLAIKIDHLANRIDLTRKSFIEYVLEFQIRTLKVALSIPGFIEGIRSIRDLNEAIRKNWKKTFSKTQKVLEDKIIELNGDSENGSE
ncbi:ribbon-helix-helix protein, CopG family [Desulfobacula sp.]|uniref:ribbon-helix-helix protein, CopG family n=1 Tax=Desulfobacula sp. TaxID=2593537 RepID=UPI0026161BFB|nr:ribbon-helix-helix protein, CopG family [Desulfobacula sp.]